LTLSELALSFRWVYAHPRLFAFSTVAEKRGERNLRERFQRHDHAGTTNWHDTFSLDNAPRHFGCADGWLLLLYLFRLVAITFFSGLVVSMAIASSVDWLHRHGLPRSVSVILIYLVLLLLLIGAHRQRQSRVTIHRMRFRSGRWVV